MMLPQRPLLELRRVGGGGESKMSAHGLWSFLTSKISKPKASTKEGSSRALTVSNNYAAIS